jgi:hypothetical protein
MNRDEPYDKDIVAGQLFPFISAQRFTLKVFFLRLGELQRFRCFAQLNYYATYCAHAQHFKE